MTEAVTFIAALSILAATILTALYLGARNAPSHPQRQPYRRHRPWNFK